MNNSIFTTNNNNNKPAFIFPIVSCMEIVWKPRNLIRTTHQIVLKKDGTAMCEKCLLGAATVDAVSSRLITAVALVVLFFCVLLCCCLLLVNKNTQ